MVMTGLSDGSIRTETPAANANSRHATRSSTTICTDGFSRQRRYTRVVGFTATYNDFDYTGAVFRLEQSYSTKEALNKKVFGYANNFLGNEGAPNFGDAQRPQPQKRPDSEQWGGVAEHVRF